MQGFEAVERSVLVFTRWFSVAWQILVFRQGPQDLPGGREWTAMAAALYLLSGFLLLQVRGISGEALLMLAVDLGLVLVFVTLVLRFSGRGERLWQSLQALWLCGAVLNAIALPFAPVLANPPGEPTVWLDLAVVMSLALIFWSIGLMGQVFRHALEWPLGRALLLSLAYAVGNILIHYHLFAPNG
ncbi:hypothetical protein [Natronospira bacteriovora]|uniref:Yip1 domain-containing protein n=1 Tax=Natronospira bacteriovora TaxID=3069753 RepID=A0ABU0W6M3_9GAMM|nr:hypothetical protein [Natronospira sp. AB-CW4]MDQ2069578.1 hypothetical protein [Natronospira sp. AB-CW4]